MLQMFMVLNYIYRSRKDIYKLVGARTTLKWGVHPVNLISAKLQI